MFGDSFVMDAWIDRGWVRDYLLSKEHPVGRFKGAFFEALGYSGSDWLRLEFALRQLAMTGDEPAGGKAHHVWPG